MTTGLQEEIGEVRQTLTGISETLHPLLSEFIRDEIEQRPRLPLAAVVLAAAYPLQDSSEQRVRRVWLAAALELLTVALDIHKLLASARVGNADVDRKLAGGTVLAGDYCFSRAAMLAAQTDNPTVVAIFSTLLQDLSEGNLRQIFNVDDSEVNLLNLLYQSGARAGSALAGAEAEATQSVVALSEAAMHWQQRENGHAGNSSLRQDVADAALSSTQQARWIELLHELSQS